MTINHAKERHLKWLAQHVPPWMSFWNNHGSEKTVYGSIQPCVGYQLWGGTHLATCHAA